MTKGRIVIITAIVLAGIMAFSSPALAKKKSRAKTKTQPKNFVLDVSLTTSYDDNILRYSDADLGLFGSDSLPSKFAIESKNDWIIRPQIRPRLQGRLIGHQPASVTLIYDYFGYVKNDVRRYSRYSIEARQYFSPRFYGQLFYSYVPRYYYRNLFVGVDSLFIAQYSPAKFSKNAFGAELGYDVTKALKAGVNYQYQHKSFNPLFNYRDLNLNGFGADAVWRASRPFKLWSIFDYEIAKAKGADMPDTILDYSYNAWDITFGVRHYPAWWPKLKPELYTSFQYRRIDYQSDRLPDIFGRHVYQFGRSDNNYQIRAGTAWKIFYDIRFEVDYAFNMKRASLPSYPNGPIFLTTSELVKKLDYTANTITFQFLKEF